MGWLGLLTGFARWSRPRLRRPRPVRLPPRRQPRQPGAQKRLGHLGLLAPALTVIERVAEAGHCGGVTVAADHGASRDPHGCPSVSSNRASRRQSLRAPSVQVLSSTHRIDASPGKSWNAPTSRAPRSRRVHMGLARAGRTRRRASPRVRSSALPNVCGPSVIPTSSGMKRAVCVLAEQLDRDICDSRADGLWRTLVGTRSGMAPASRASSDKAAKRDEEGTSALGAVAPATGTPDPKRSSRQAPRSQQTKARDHVRGRVGTQ